MISTAAADLPPVLGSERSLRPSWRVFKFAIACGGVAWVLMQLLLGYQMGIFPYPGGDTLIWDRVGDQLRAGQPIYYLADPATDSFWYAPPWAVLFGALSWLPVGILGGLILATKIAALRVIGGSWIGAGIACWFPLVAFDLAGGSFNLVLAAAIVSAVHRRPAGAVLTALAKWSPLLAIDPRDWRPAFGVFALAVLVTVPWLGLWPAWVDQIVGAAGLALGAQVPVPYVVRLTVAAGLLAVRKPWSRSTAAVLAIPALYWGSLVMFIAPVSIVIDMRRKREAHLPSDSSHRGPAAAPTTPQ